MTAAKIGRSMKKRENMAAPAYFFGSAGEGFAGCGGAGLAGSAAGFAGAGLAGVIGPAPGAAAGATEGAPTLIGAPGMSFAMPSTMTTSPGLSPDSMSHRLRPSTVVQSPATIG